MSCMVFSSKGCKAGDSPPRSNGLRRGRAGIHQTQISTINSHRCSLSSLYNTAAHSTTSIIPHSTIIKPRVISTSPLPRPHHHPYPIAIILLLHATNRTRADRCGEPGHAAKWCPALDQARAVVESSFWATGCGDGKPAVVADVGFPALGLAHC